MARRAPVWTRGEEAGLAAVRSGVVRESEEWVGQTLILGFFGRNAVLGSDAAFGETKSSTGEAYEDTVVLWWSAPLVQSLAESDAGFAWGLAQLENRRRESLQRRFVELAHRTAKQRLASMFLQLGDDFGVRDSRGTIVNLRLTHREMATYIGATRETVSFAVADLRRDGLIETEGKRVVLIERRKLRALALSSG